MSTGRSCSSVVSRWKSPRVRSHRFLMHCVPLVRWFLSNWECGRDVFRFFSLGFTFPCLSGNAHRCVAALSFDVVPEMQSDLTDEETLIFRNDSSPVEKQRYSDNSSKVPEERPVKIFDLLSSSCESLLDLDDVEPIVFATGNHCLSTSPNNAGSDNGSYYHRSLSPMDGVIALPPSAMRTIIPGDSCGSGGRDDVVKPILHGRTVSKLSVSEDGFIKLKDYKISFDVLGGGQLSEVRVAISEKNGQRYAVKIFSKTKLQKMNMLLRSSRNPVEGAYREAAWLRRLHHPNVIQLIDFIDDDLTDNIYLVLELMDRVLMDLPSDFRYKEPLVRKYFIDVVQGIDHLHFCGVVHRDLKPQNLLVSHTDVVKIADFNFCEELVLLDDGSEAEVLTCAFGTPAFTAPECLLPDKKHCQGRPLDMWGLGATLYVLVTADLPFKAVLLSELFHSIVNDSVEFPENVFISVELKCLILGLLDKDPRKRSTLKDLKKSTWLNLVDD